MRLSLLGLATFGLALIITMPVSRLLSTPAPGLNLFGVEGSLLSGRIGGVAGRNGPLLQSLEWKFSPLQLLWLRLGYEVTALPVGASEALSARVRLSPLGRWSARDLKGELSLQSLAAMTGQPYLPMEGLAQADFGELGWKQDHVLLAQGKLRLMNLRWTLAQTPLALGDFEAAVETGGEGLEVKITTLAGALEVTGDASYKTDRSYEYHLQLRPRAGADPALQNLLRTLGNPDNQAWYHLRRSGRL